MKTLGKIGKNNFARPDPDGRRGRPRTRSGSGSTWLEIPCNDVSSPKEFGQDFENHRAGRPKVEFCKFIHVFKRLLAKIELQSSTTGDQRRCTFLSPSQRESLRKPRKRATGARRAPGCAPWGARDPDARFDPVRQRTFAKEN